jgi:hypothetical protein
MGLRLWKRGTRVTLPKRTLHALSVHSYPEHVVIVERCLELPCPSSCTSSKLFHEIAGRPSFVIADGPSSIGKCFLFG